MSSLESEVVYAIEPKAKTMYCSDSHGESFLSPDSKVARNRVSSSIGVVGWIRWKYASTRLRGCRGVFGPAPCPAACDTVPTLGSEESVGTAGLCLATLKSGAMVNKTRRPAVAEEP